MQINIIHSHPYEKVQYEGFERYFKKKSIDVGFSQTVICININKMFDKSTSFLQELCQVLESIEPLEIIMMK